jgi:photosystem II stability/assembly factor-like uncharacterized protein
MRHGVAVSSSAPALLVSLCAVLFAQSGHAQPIVWEKLTGFPGYNPYVVVADPSDRLYAGTYMNGIWRSSDGGDHWVWIVGDYKDYLAILADQSGTVLASGTDHYVYRCTDGGSAWVPSSRLSADYLDKYWRISSDSLLLRGGTTISSRLFVSVDAGVTWYENFYLSQTTLTSLVKTSNGKLLMGTRSMSSGKGVSGLWYSTNLGDGWRLDTSSFHNIDVNGLVAARDKHKIFATAGRGVYRSYNDGVTWFDTGSRLGPLSEPSALYMNQVGHIYAVSWSHVLRSTDDGKTWDAVESGLTPGSLKTLSFDSNDVGYIVDGTSIYRTQTSTTSILENELTSPTETRLEQNYPNPFNGEAKIGFRVSDLGSRVRLAVYDMLGREVAVLVDTHQNPGTYTVSFDATKLSSGTYLYRMQVGGFVQTRRMVVLR